MKTDACRRAIWLILSLSFFAPKAVASSVVASVTLEITGPVCEVGAPCRFDVYLERTPSRSGHSAPTRALLETIEALGGDVVLDVDLVEHGHRLVVENENYWCAAEVVTDSTERQVARCHLLPASVVSGELKITPPAEDVETATANGALVVLLSSVSPAKPRHAENQPLAEDGTGTGLGETAITVVCPFVERKLSCVLPMGRYDARFELSGYSPHFVRDLIVDRQPKRLDLTFRPGALVAGWLDLRGEGGTPDDDVSVLLIPASGPSDANPRRMAALESLSLEASVKSDGRFHFEGVAAGKYILRAAADGPCPTEVQVRIPSDIRTVEIRKPLVLDHCASVELMVDPPVDFWGEPWSLKLRQHQAVTGTVGPEESMTVGLNGWSSIGGLPSGSWRVSVRDSKGGVWWSENVAIETQQESLYVPLESVEVRGTVMRGGEPVPGTLVFGTRSRSPSIPLSVDDDGRFRGFLPTTGEWPMEFDDGQKTYFPAVQQVEQRPGQSFAEVDISLSGARLEGLVLDGEEPVEGAFVYAFREDTKLEAEAFVRTDHEGIFVIESVRPGSLRLLARQADLSSESKTLEVGDDEEISGLNLILQQRNRIRGQVLAQGRGVAGAQLLAFGPPGRTDLDKVASTGIDGTFSLGLQPGADAMSLAMVASGYAFDIQAIDPKSAQANKVVFEAYSAGAEVVWPLASGGSEGQILARGAIVSLPRLLPLLLEAGSAAFEEPRSVRLHIAPGAWSFCTGSTPTCTTETITAGQDLFLGAGSED